MDEDEDNMHIQKPSETCSLGVHGARVQEEFSFAEFV
jgi:hypothetical protein